MMRTAELLEQIYATIGDPDRWLDIVTGLLRVLDAPAGGLVTASLDGRRIRSGVLDPEAQDSYDRHYGGRDPVLPWVEASPVGSIWSGTDLVGSRPADPFHVEWSRRHGMDDGILVNLGRPHPAACATTLVVTRPFTGDAFATRDRLAAVRILVPHLRQALAAQARIEEADTIRDGVVEILENTPHAVLIVCSTGEVLHANSAARDLLDGKGGLHVDSWGMVCADGPSSCRQHFRHAVERATSGAGSSGPSGAVVTVPHPTGTRPLVVQVVPMRRAAVGGGLAMITVVDGERTPVVSAEMLCTVFQLTPSEARVASLLAGGYTLRGIAAGLHVSSTTVRTHLQHVFTKTGTARQSELVRILGSLGWTEGRSGDLMHS
ncbi:helix-turn-helix transcriptional regulator [Rhodococcus sp. NPDC058505]|uniref:helix-turn-helix transcriptional regulator n=1 Tax=Rhodococcus sp. NPDC058505 TaxID=3346531 RepID=UPI0036678EB8